MFKKIKIDTKKFQNGTFLFLIKCECKNYLYIYNIKLIKEKTQLLKTKPTTITSKQVIYFIYS